MKTTWSILLLSLAVIACNLTRNKETVSSTEPASSPKPVAVKKIFDLPAIIGKSPAEVKSIIGPPKGEFGNDSIGGLEYDFDIVSGTIHFSKGKFSDLIFTTDNFVFEKPEQFGDLFGVDLRGVTPTSDYDFATIFENLPIKGATVARLSIGKSSTTKGFNDFHVDMR